MFDFEFRNNRHFGRALLKQLSTTVERITEIELFKSGNEEQRMSYAQERSSTFKVIRRGLSLRVSVLMFSRRQSSAQPEMKKVRCELQVTIFNSKITRIVRKKTQHQTPNLFTNNTKCNTRHYCYERMSDRSCMRVGRLFNGLDTDQGLKWLIKIGSHRCDKQI
jgi:hypothetical protein